MADVVRTKDKNGDDPTLPSKDSDVNRRSPATEANTCIGLGIGVGALGAAAAAISGAVCPLCVVIAPSLVGFGLLRRLTCKKDSTAIEEKETTSI